MSLFLNDRSFLSTMEELWTANKKVNVCIIKLYLKWVYCRSGFGVRSESRITTDVETGVYDIVTRENRVRHCLRS